MLIQTANNPLPLRSDSIIGISFESSLCGSDRHYFGVKGRAFTGFGYL